MMLQVKLTPFLSSSYEILVLVRYAHSKIFLFSPKIKIDVNMYFFFYTNKNNMYLSICLNYKNE